MKKIHILMIDPQYDFCDPTGTLFVPGADKDMERLGKMVARIGESIAGIHVTLDQHHMLDVAHPIMWKGTDGKNPSPFTIITTSDIENGVWTPVIPSLIRRMIDYTKELDAGGRYPLCIWPPHCLIGSVGSTIHHAVEKELIHWAQEKKRHIDFVSKGSNFLVEHYSAVKAEVVDPGDPSTQMNTRLVRTLEDVDDILLCGEAGSHCLANTALDVANEFSDDSYISKFILLTDATSPVPGFENLQEDFINKMTARGMRLSTTEDILK